MNNLLQNHYLILWSLKIVELGNYRAHNLWRMDFWRMDFVEVGIYGGWNLWMLELMKVYVPFCSIESPINHHVQG
jgi:hypothetical protein